MGVVRGGAAPARLGDRRVPDNNRRSYTEQSLRERSREKEMANRLLFAIFSYVFLLLFVIGWGLFVAGWGLETDPTTREKLLELAVYQYHNHWGVVVSGGLVGILTFIHISVATCAKRTAFLRVAGSFALFFHIFYLACVGYPMHSLSLCLWEDLFGTGLNANTTTAPMVSAGAGCPQVFNLYFMFSGGLTSIVFLGLAMMVTYLVPLMPLTHHYRQGRSKYN